MSDHAHVGRNDPCPCGSGKKYKHCHLGQDRAEEARTGRPVEPAATVTATPRDNRVLYALIAVGALVTAAMGAWKGASAAGLFGAVSVLGIAGYLILRSMPPPNQNSGDPSGLNFGG